jgi:hypothetical protein
MVLGQKMAHHRFRHLKLAKPQEGQSLPLAQLAAQSLRL